MAQFMKLLVTIALTFAITTAIITTTTTKTNTTTETVSLEDPSRDLTPQGATKIRRSRFLAERDVEGLRRPKPRSPKAPDFCEPKICSSTGGSSRMACCNNKCMNLSTDNRNCGACNKRCRFGETCCGGRCTNLSFNKTHCGECNHSCKQGGWCAYGLCNYA
ncbi:hypothetical protein N665_0014s0162 [Sinapis alba]|nr:hypothetical protein N665_0014s0162 [Sinapis alba]